jgi:hypothetical protein
VRDIDDDAAVARSTRAASTSSCDSSSFASSSTSTRSWSVGSTTMSPEARRMSSVTGPETSKVLCILTP